LWASSIAISTGRRSARILQRFPSTASATAVRSSGVGKAAEVEHEAAFGAEVEAGDRDLAGPAPHVPVGDPEVVDPRRDRRRRRIVRGALLGSCEEVVEGVRCRQRTGHSPERVELGGVADGVEAQQEGLRPQRQVAGVGAQQVIGFVPACTGHTNGRGRGSEPCCLGRRVAGVGDAPEVHVVRVRIEHDDGKGRLRQQPLEDRPGGVGLAGAALAAHERVPGEPRGDDRRRHVVGTQVDADPERSGRGEPGDDDRHLVVVGAADPAFAERCDGIDPPELVPVERAEDGARARDHPQQRPDRRRDDVGPWEVEVGGHLELGSWPFVESGRTDLHHHALAVSTGLHDRERPDDETDLDRCRGVDLATVGGHRDLGRGEAFVQRVPRVDLPR
jgi:hypothetical protein